LIVTVENIVSCFIGTHDADKRDFNFMIGTKWHSCNDRPTGADRRELRWSDRNFRREAL